jgi:chitinase
VNLKPLVTDGGGRFRFMLRASDEAFFPSIGLVLNLVQTIDALFTRRLSLLQLLYGTTPALPPMEAARAPP